MQRIIVVTALLLLGAWAPSAVAESVKGEVVDLSCYLSHPATGRGPGHRKCAETCAKKGLPVGILTADGTVLLLLEDHAHATAYTHAVGRVAEEVSIEGKRVSQGGVAGLVVERVE